MAQEPQTSTRCNDASQGCSSSPRHRAGQPTWQLFETHPENRATAPGIASGIWYYLTPDPIGLAGGINPYVYVENDPVNAVDPLGLDAIVMTPGGPMIIPGPVSSPVVNLSPEQSDQMKRDLRNLLVPWPILIWNYLTNENTEEGNCEVPQEGDNTNPYKGPVDKPVIVVDPAGNAIPVGVGEQVGGSPDGKWIEVKDSKGNPTGMRKDGPHKPGTHGNYPEGLQPHAHLPGDPGGIHWWPIYK